MTNEEKLNFAKYALTQKIESIDTWQAFKSMVANASPAGIKAFVIDKLQERAQSLRDSATAGNSVASEIDQMVGEL